MQSANHISISDVTALLRKIVAVAEATTVRYLRSFLATCFVSFCSEDSGCVVVVVGCGDYQTTQFVTTKGVFHEIQASETDNTKRKH